jgi:hypothetical protein
MPTRHAGNFSKNAMTWRRCNWRRITGWPAALTPCTWKTDLAISNPIVVTVCMLSSSESWEPQQAPRRWHSRAGGGAVHSINSGLMHCSKFQVLATIRLASRQVKGRTVATALASAKPASGSAKLYAVRRRYACDDCSRLGLSRVCPSASNYQLISTPIIIGAWIDIDWLNNGRRRNPIAFGSHALRVDGVKSRLQ